MKKINWILIAMISFFPVWLWGKQVSPETARQVAETQVRSRNQWRSSQELNLAFTKTTHSKTATAPTQVTGNVPADVLYYVFNVGESGFVIVSGDDIAVPILGYSDAGTYDPDHLSPNFVYWMDDFLAKEIEQAITQNMPQSEKTKEQWEAYIAANTFSLRSATAVSPLLTTRWNQTSPYSDLCPHQALTGCAATAMAQIMKRYNYPATRTVTIPGYTTRTNKWDVPAITGTTAYAWSSMADTYNSASSDASKTAVATLMYHCGASAEMDYDYDGSGAYTRDIGLAWITYYDYDQGLQYKVRDYYSNNDWDAMLKTEINAGRPVYYAGYNSSSGHAFVCDGYNDAGDFHFNWGWGGLYDGYFVTTSLNPGSGGAGSGAGTYNEGQEIMVNIQPNSGGEKSYEIKINAQTNISASKTTLDRGESFTVNAPVVNMGLFNFSGNTGIAIVDESDNIVSVIGQRSINLNPGYYYLNPFSCTIPTSDTTGDCRIRVVYKSSDASQWSIATGTPGYTDVLNLTITTNPPRTHGIAIVNGSNLTCSATAVNRGETFTVSAQYGNIGTTTAIGDYGIALVTNDDQILEIIGISQTGLSSPPDYSWSPFNATCGVSSSITPGNYKIRAVFRPAGENWSIIYGESSSVVDFVLITVNSGIVPDNSNVRIYANFVVSSNPVNQFSPLNVQIKLINPSSAATSFVGELELGLYDSQGTLLEVIEKENAVVPNDQGLHIFTFNSISVNSPGGTYIMSLYQTSVDGIRKKVNNNGQSYNDLSFTVIGIPPHVSAVLPADGTTNIPVEGQLIITFDKPMNTVSNVGVVSLGGGTVSNEYRLWSSNNTVCTIPYSDLAYNTTYTYNISGFKDDSGNLLDAITSGYSFQTIDAPSTTTWNSQNGSTDWAENANWTNGLPGTTTKVTIPSPDKVSNFPILTNNVSVAEIHFEPGAQIGNQSFLSGKAFVQYDFSNRERWSMLSIPLQQVYPGDFTFGGYPQTWVRTFTTATNGNVTQGSWVTQRGSQTPFSFGDGFVLFLNDDNHSGEPVDNAKGLKLLNNTRELPFFQHHITSSPDYDIYHAVHQAHDYSGAEENGVSTFYNVVNNNGKYERVLDDPNQRYNVNRDESAYQLAGASVSKTVSDFINGSFALIGNPYMAALDFSLFYDVNKIQIKPNYYIWTNNGYTIFTPYGTTGEDTGDNPQGQLIAPLQGFIVEKAETANNSQLSFNEDMTTVNKSATLLRSSENGNKLDIVARNEAAGIRTFIAKREGGQDEFGNLDARKIINSISDVPEIYTLKPYKGGWIAVAANIINNDNLLIPVGLATSYSGNITLSFSGMDAYDANLTLIDAVANREIDLTGLASYDYIVNYTPKMINGEPTVCEDRFFIRISKTGNSIWKGDKDNNWNESSNWVAEQVPSSTDIVTIPTNATNFPILTSNVSVAEIHFEPGAQIGNQSFLSGKAFVQYDFNSRERWSMLSIPLQQVYPGDFTFGGYPQTWVRTFTTSTNGNVTQGSWVTQRGSQTPFSFGDGFVLFLNADDHAGEPVDNTKGLKLLNNIRELPFFQHHIIGSPDYATYHAVHQAHDYSGVEENGVSTFYSVENDGGQYVRGTDFYNVNRDESAYQLAGASFSKTVSDFINGPFALIGNPYMAALDFSLFYDVNKTQIKPNYYIWINRSYTVFTLYGSAGMGDAGATSSLIAPLQGFIVEKSETATNSQLSFNEDMTTVNNSATLLRSSENGNKLDIVARNEVAGIRTFIAKREGGQDEFGNLDARKIINSISDVPEIYTLKPYKSGLMAVAVNIINSDDLLIPVGLATSYSGNITLSFSDMDAYDANLTLIDAVANKEIDLTGLAFYEYSFNYTPKKVNGEAAVCEDRFFIRISKTVTGIKETIADKVNVYEANGLIQVVSGASNLIKEVAVYNLQGSLIYKESAIHAISHTVNQQWPTGAYIVKVVSEKNTDNVKLIIR